MIGAREDLPDAELSTAIDANVAPATQATRELVPARRWPRLRVLRFPIAIALCSTVVTFAFGFCAYLVIENAMPPEGWLGIWNRWDATHYLELAQSGYTADASDEQRFMIVFFPLYPHLIYLAHFLIPDWHVAAVVLSNVCCAGAFCYCFLLTEKEFGRRAAKVAVFYFSIFPTAYFLHIGYSESLFLVLTIGAFYYARLGRWLPCALLGMLATGSRISGLAIMLPLAFEYLHQKNFRWRQIRWDGAFLGLIPLGLLAYLYLNYHYFGDPLKFWSFSGNIGIDLCLHPGPPCNRAGRISCATIRSSASCSMARSWQPSPSARSVWSWRRFGFGLVIRFISRSAGC